MKPNRCLRDCSWAETSHGNPCQAVFWLASQTGPDAFPPTLGLQWLGADVCQQLVSDTSSLTAAVPRRFCTDFLSGLSAERLTGL